MLGMWAIRGDICQHGVELPKREAMYTSDRKLEGRVTQAHWSPEDATLILSKKLQGFGVFGLLCLNPARSSLFCHSSL